MILRYVLHAHNVYNRWSSLIVGSLSNHDDNGNENLQISIFDKEKQYFCTLCTCIFHFLTFYIWVDDVSIWWQLFNFVFLCPKRWVQLNSRIVRTHFSSIMSLNNWKMIAETRSYIFRWRSRFRRRRVCLSSLVSRLELFYWNPTSDRQTKPSNWADYRST